MATRREVNNRLNWIPVTETPLPPKEGKYLVTLRDEFFPEFSQWNEIATIHFNGHEWAREAGRIVAWCKPMPYIEVSQRIELRTFAEIMGV